MKIRNYATEGRYKFSIYLTINPNLEKSPYINCIHPLATDIIRFRLGSHKLPIEKGDGVEFPEKNASVPLVKY